MPALRVVSYPSNSSRGADVSVVCSTGYYSRIGQQHELVVYSTVNCKHAHKRWLLYVVCCGVVKVSYGLYGLYVLVGVDGVEEGRRVKEEEAVEELCSRYRRRSRRGGKGRAVHVIFNVLKNRPKEREKKKSTLTRKTE